jgi:hypothetical protein
MRSRVTELHGPPDPAIKLDGFHAISLRAFAIWTFAVYSPTLSESCFKVLTPQITPSSSRAKDVSVTFPRQSKHSLRPGSLQHVLDAERSVDTCPTRYFRVECRSIFCANLFALWGGDPCSIQMLTYHDPTGHSSTGVRA